jgi:hypothetical protein
LLAFASVYFLESGLFNGLRPIQIKKSYPFRLPSISQARSLCHPIGATPGAGFVE